MFDIGSILGEIGSGVGIVDGVIKALKGAKDLAKKEPSNADISAINERVAQAYDMMVKVKQDQLALLQAAIALQTEKAAFEKMKSAIERFDDKSKRYILQEVGPNSLAYILKPEFRAHEPVHFACAHCFDDTKLSLFQLHERKFNFDTLKCHRCSTTIQVPNEVKAEARTARVKKGWAFFEE